MFDWDNFRILAENLKQKEDEASQRTSIGRLYYAVYWTARNFLEKDGFQIRDNVGKGVHEQVWGEFNRREGTTNKAIYRKGDELKKNRVKADYWSEIRKPKELVDDSFRIAQSALTYLRQITPKGDA